MKFHRNILAIDASAETERIIQTLRNSVGREMHRRGAVLGISGGIDSSVVLALCVRAFGPQPVVALILPDRDSDPTSESYARQVANKFGIQPILVNITRILEAYGCYHRRDEAIQRVFPEYDPALGFKAKIVLPSNLIEGTTLNTFSLSITTPSGEERTHRLTASEFLQIEAASNLKQRTRMSMLYYHSERLNYAVVGTTNRDEHEQGFFVKYGDGGVDIQPIAHLYKTQVYQLAEHLDVPEEIRRRIPTTDTYSAGQTQEEFFFRIPFDILDLLAYAQEHAVPLEEIAALLGLTEEQIKHVFADLDQKKRATSYLRLPPVKLDPLH